MRELTELAHELRGAGAVLRALARFGAPPAEADARRVRPLTAAAQAGEPVSPSCRSSPAARSPLRSPAGGMFNDDDGGHLAAVGAIAALAGSPAPAPPSSL